MFEINMAYEHKYRRLLHYTEALRAKQHDICMLPTHPGEYGHIEDDLIKGDMVFWRGPCLKSTHLYDKHWAVLQGFSCVQIEGDTWQDVFEAVDDVISTEDVNNEWIVASFDKVEGANVHIKLLPYSTYYSKLTGFESLWVASNVLMENHGMGNDPVLYLSAEYTDNPCHVPIVGNRWLDVYSAANELVVFSGLYDQEIVAIEHRNGKWYVECDYTFLDSDNSQSEVEQ